ncbi:hypothetical protein GCK32_009377 [Trichostrongylus colubriformis]|uniref:SCP domain-containing protein n=1 Tax=Trichostrongylus colubriformis TaxID=6319 RepID=A0AAN8F140_TRICO
MLLLPLIFLVIHGTNGQNLDLDKVDETINNFRSTVAKGEYKLQNGDPLQGSKSLFKLQRTPLYENLAMLNTLSCSRGNSLPDGTSMNYYQIDYLPSDMEPDVIAEFALSEWEQEPLVHGIDKDAVYKNEAIKNFANLVYYQSTLYGCYERYCPDPLPSHVFACVFNRKPTLGQELYKVGGTGCENEKDCTKLLPSSTCDEVKGLCEATKEFPSAPTTTITPTTTETTTPTTTTETEPTTPSSTTGTEPTTPSSTTGTEPTPSSTTEAGPTSSDTATTAETISTATVQASSTIMMETTSKSYDYSMTDEIREKIITMHNYRR